MTAEQLKELFFYNPDDGMWTRLYKPRTKAHPCVGSMTSKGYLQLKVQGKVYAQHRLAWLYMTGELPDGEIDHINGDRTDNRFSNLRVVSSTVNKQNMRRARAHSLTGILGVTYDKKRDKYVARIKVGAKNLHLGQHETAQQAHEAYLMAKRVLHAGCTI